MTPEEEEIEAKKIMEGQKEFFNDGQQTNSTTQPGPTDSQGETS